MKNPEGSSRLELLKARQQELAQKITLLDAAGTKNDEWNQLHNEHEEITAQIEEVPNADEQKLAA